MKNSRRQRALPVVRAVVHRWDPYSLLRNGAPPEEFDREIAAIVKQLPRIQTPKDAAATLSRVFSSSLGADMFPPEHCPGEALYQALSTQGLLDHP
jgi:hypothetical protein